MLQAQARDGSGDPVGARRKQGVGARVKEYAVAVGPAAGAVGRVGRRRADGVGAAEEVDGPEALLVVVVVRGLPPEPAIDLLLVLPPGLLAQGHAVVLGGDRARAGALAVVRVDPARGLGADHGARRGLVGRGRPAHRGAPARDARAERPARRRIAQRRGRVEQGLGCQGVQLRAGAGDRAPPLQLRGEGRGGRLARALVAEVDEALGLRRAGLEPRLPAVERAREGGLRGPLGETSVGADRDRRPAPFPPRPRVAAGAREVGSVEHRDVVRAWLGAALARVVADERDAVAMGEQALVPERGLHERVLRRACGGMGDARVARRDVAARGEEHRLRARRVGEGDASHAQAHRDLVGDRAVLADAEHRPVDARRRGLRDVDVGPDGLVGRRRDVEGRHELEGHGDVGVELVRDGSLRPGTPRARGLGVGRGLRHPGAVRTLRERGLLPRRERAVRLLAQALDLEIPDVEELDLRRRPVEELAAGARRGAQGRAARAGEVAEASPRPSRPWRSSPRAPRRTRRSRSWRRRS